VSAAEDVAICDALRYAHLLVERAELVGGSLGDVRAELETTWLECAVAENSLGENMIRKGRAPVSGEPELVAALGDAQDKLTQAQTAAEVAIASARGKVSLAQAALDSFRRGLIAEHAQAWRGEASRLRQVAAETDEMATTTVKVHVLGGTDGYRTEPSLRFTRDLVGEEAAGADAKAQLYENYLARGDELNGEALQQVAAELEMPAAAELVAV
jgi:hypothetical protein